jgi:simple sugar transport system substrate-binding protein
MRKNVMKFALLAMAAVLVLTACGGGGGSSKLPKLGNSFTFGMLLVGPHNDQGWSQATYDGGQYVEQHVTGA